MGNRNSAQVDISFYNRPAYQVVHVVKESPADKAGLLPYFDFLTVLPPITTFNSCPLPYDEFVRVALKRQPTLELSVFNCATGCIRKVTLVPSRYGTSSLDLTGFILRTCIISEAISQVEHVTDVSVGSPAFNVGLVPFFDYIIATDDGNFFDLHQIVRGHNPSECLRIYVIDIFLKASRAVQIPELTVLGEGRLGCTLASGYLHRIPSFKLNFYLSRNGSETTTVASRKERVSIEPPGHVTESREGHEYEHQYHKHGKGRAHSTNSSKGPCAQNSASSSLESSCNGHSHQNGHSQPPPPPVSDPNSCTFVTRLQLTQPLPTANSSPASANGVCSQSFEIPKLAMPISVQIPKDIVATVLPELIKYQREHQSPPVTGAKEEKDDSIETPLQSKQTTEPEAESVSN